ncbi:MAG: APC family permease [Cyclobacteriaceae bacterium]
MTTEEGLKREVGTWGLTSNIINTVIGSGIFVLPALVSEGLGAAGIFAYIICGILIALVMLCFAELGSKITTTGGAYAYIDNAFGSYFGFLTTNIFIFGSALMSTAAVANAMVDMLSYLIPVFSNQGFRIGFFVTMFSGLAVINILGIRQGITLVKITTLAKLFPLALIITLGTREIIPGNLIIDDFPKFSDFGEISLILFFAFQGAENSLSVGGEVRHPQRTFPRAILFGFALILTVYICIQIVSQGILGNAFADYKSAPLAEVARRVIGPFGITLVTAGAAVSMFGYISGDLMNLPRVLFRSALDNVTPIKPLSLVHKKFSTPYLSVIAYAVLACFFSITGEFKQMAVLASTSAMLLYLGVAFATMKLKSKENNPDHFRIPGGHVVPILAAITILWLLSNLGTKEIVGMIIFISILSLIYFLLKWLRLKKIRNKR